VSSSVAASVEAPAVRVPLAELDMFSRAVLTTLGADAATADAATRAMMHATRLGVDSHGIRLLPHYVKVMENGRVNPRPEMRLTSRSAATATLDADHGHGAPAAYLAMDHAVELAASAGIGAVGIRNSSHFGPAGAFAMSAAERGLIGIAMCNADSFVRLHDGASRFHGTNPIACAVPVEGDRPWLLDMATSAIPYNRVMLYRSLGLPLPEAVASCGNGADTTNAAEVEMLAPLGAAFGFKGAGLAGLAEIFSAVMTGMRLSFDLLPMAGPDLSTPRGMGAFVMAIRPDAFVDRADFNAGIRRYVTTLRASPARAGQRVLAPGDREWVEADRRESDGAPLDPGTLEEFHALAERFGLEAPQMRTGTGRRSQRNSPTTEGGKS
jgi:LDH2 family malate/lactate/ureidoglycolate dehydrogenase